MKMRLLRLTLGRGIESIEAELRRRAERGGMESGLHDGDDQAGAEPTAAVRENGENDRPARRLSGPQTRWPARSPDDVDRRAADARLRCRMEHVRA